LSIFALVFALVYPGWLCYNLGIFLLQIPPACAGRRIGIQIIKFLCLSSQKY